MSPLRRALVAQLIGGAIAASLIQIAYPRLFAAPLIAAAVQGLCAALVSDKLGAAKWWLIIHFSFLPAVLWAGQLGSGLGIDPAWYFVCFVALLLVFWRTDKSQVPLYLSNAATTSALAALLPEAPCRVVDLGCGNGGLLRKLAARRPDCSFVGIEHAPLPWLWARLKSLRWPNLTIHYGDFWRLSLDPFDIVYAFLSPVPMPRLMAKARNEMRSGKLLVCNSFAVPGVKPEFSVAVDDRRETILYCYRF